MANVHPTGLNSLCGISRVALLPHGSSKTAAEALMHLEDAQVNGFSMLLKTNASALVAAFLVYFALLIPPFGRTPSLDLSLLCLSRFPPS